MARNAENRVIRHLRRAALRKDGAGLTDGELLEQYVSQRDEAAFEALVRRHGPMVLGVCRRVLRNETDAEDAFQATFLVLVRKAASIRSRNTVSNWLYGVAQNTARKAKAMNRKRRTREQEAGRMPKPEAAEEVWREVQALLDIELSRLPEKYRVPIVMCDLEGKTIREAARQLGWPQGTTATRLARGRALLARRLASHGLTLSAGVLTAALSAGTATASVPPALVLSTVQAAARFAAEPAAATGMISAKVATLMEGVLKTMLLNQLKGATAVLLVAGLMVLAIGQLVGLSGAAPQKDNPQADRPARKKDDGKGGTTWQVRTTLEGHVARVNRMAFSPDGRLLASASDDSTVKIWDLATGKELVTLKEPDGGGLRGVAFAPDGKTIATAGGDKVVRLWDAAQGTRLQEFRGHTAATYSVIFTPDGRTLVSGGGCANYPDRGQTGYGELRFWDPATGKERTTGVQCHTWPVAHLALTPDGKTLISGGYDNLFKVWDWDGKEPPKEQRSVEVGQSQGIYAMALSPDARTLIVTCDGTVKRFAVATGKEQDRLEKSAYRDGWLWDSVALSADGKTIAAASPIQEWEDKDKRFIGQRRSDILLWDAATGKLREKLQVDECVSALAFSPDGKTLVSGCRGKTRRPEPITKGDDLEEEQRGVVKLWALKRPPDKRK